MTAAVELRQVTKARGDFRLGPVDLTLETGLITAIVGPNGSGKSTLFRTIMNLVHPDGGTVRLFGQKAYPEREAAVKQRIGFVGDVLTPFEEGLKVGQWKRFVQRWYPTWNEPLWQRLSEQLEIPLDKKISALSTGMHKRLSFALAVAHQPDLLLLDEPSSGLDPFAWRIVMEEIRSYMEAQDRTVFIATHIMEEVRRLADVIVFMHGGRIVGVYEKDQLMEHWKTLWVKARPGEMAGLPGVIKTEEEISGVTRIVSNEAARTKAALVSREFTIVETRSVELEDILWHLMRQNKKNGQGD